MRRLAAIIGLSLLLLSACGGGGEDTTAACAFRYWDGTVGTCLPNSWHVVDRSGLDQRGVPRDVVVAFQADAPAAGQFPTVSVTREALAEHIAPSAYSAASVESVRSLPQYEELDVRDLLIDDEDVKLHIFSAQPRTDSPKTRFYQLSTTVEKVGYTFTAAVPLSVESSLENQILLILQNATFVKPAEGEG